ncbi:MAG TPA: sugar phosphate isomerase/epimerase family protein [Bacillota bacterium]|nr:sugar phosphate isomerase/epimerase family protein [Bacillota bacterium]
MKFSISNIAWSIDQDEKVYSLMKKYGFTGLEIAPNRLIEGQPYDNKELAGKIAGILKWKYGIVISSMQSILFGRCERLFGTDLERKELIDHLKKAVDFAEVIGCGNLVFGSPKTRNIEIRKESNYANAVAFFREIGEYAARHRTVVSMEANPAIYGTNFINRTEEAVKLVQDVNCNGFRLNLDFGTILENGEDVKSVDSILELVNHVHISEPHLVLIRKRKEHQVLAEILKRKKYERFISIEMKKNEQINLDKIEEILYYIADVFGGN